ncbi:hypothetical protein [Algoriphagus zhangzhouensis]|uniref:Uncharacterized protein n=1 Tax=Algoriphagus zhangzhouensis TaxID=1073327 RepID=A0A1M7Z747_9BACT|nr:hypothetical protein [Algoriphagus zhangzhouensis]TDY49312.1 hypothetical protein A8938_1004 [Algoriphagus zhangzhouensis]SHO60753.1 hypothetical protein SAMN04488108_1004 [Algoriphagus zhangzhouensis]
MTTQKQNTQDNEAKWYQDEGLKKFIHEEGKKFVSENTLTISNRRTNLEYEDHGGALSKDETLWKVIRSRKIDFANYEKFITSIMCPTTSENVIKKESKSTDNCKEKVVKPILSNQIPFHNSQAYSVLKNATELYVKIISDAGNNLDYEINSISLSNSPYIDRIKESLKDFSLTLCNDECGRFEFPVLSELIWNYWHEEGYLVQTMNAISHRFQNIKTDGKNALNQMDIDPLRPLSNILWGYIQDTQHRLTIPRRAYEYENHYGINIIGKAISNLNPVNSRSGFMAAFNNLLNKCAHFYRERDNIQRIPDGFPVLNALKEVHMILAEGAHNQFGDLPTVSKIEMLIEQWILSRPEVREFLGGKVMIPYSQGWMPRVDSMKNLQGWDPVSINNFHDLAIFGEQLILSIRYGDWYVINQANFAAQWADEWRNEIQGYIHRYQVVTGVDLSANAPDYAKRDYHIKPAILIKRRLSQQ